MKIPSFTAVLAAMALLGGGCLWWSAPPTTTPERAPQTPPTTSALWAEANGVVALDQAPGKTVIVSSLILEQNGWVVIHKDAGGKPGPVIGETYVTAGEHAQVVVNLRESTIDGMTYYAMLHKDDGDRVFTISKDAPVQSSVLQGIIMANFVADADAGEPPIVSP